MYKILYYLFLLLIIILLSCKAGLLLALNYSRIPLGSHNHKFSLIVLGLIDFRVCFTQLVCLSMDIDFQKGAFFCYPSHRCLVEFQLNASELLVCFSAGHRERHCTYVVLTSIFRYFPLLHQRAIRLKILSLAYANQNS